VTTTTALATFIVLFLGIAALSQSKRIPPGFWHHPLLFALSLLGVSGVILFYGSIELVGRYGVSGLIGLFAFSLPFIFSPLFLEPVRWLSRSHAFISLPDLLVYRFRNPNISRASGLLMAVASLPLAAAQLTAFVSLQGGSLGNELGLTATILGVVAVFVVLFGTPRRSASALPGVTAIAAILALLTLFGCGFFAIYQVFGGLGELNQWAESSGQDQVIMRFDNAHALILLFLPMATILPQLGFMHTLSAWQPRQYASTWMFPALVMVATLPVLPLFWAGLSLKVDAPLHQYINVLPQVFGIPWLHFLSTLTVLFVGVSTLAVTAIALGKILVISLAIDPDKPQRADLDAWMIRCRCIASLVWLCLVFAFAAINTSDSLTDLTIAGMIGMIQILPAIIGTLYAPKMNYKGVLAGMAVGCSLWFLGILSHSIFNRDTLDLFGKSIAIGPENWPFWLLESLVANLLVALLVSMYTRTSEEELNHAHLCMVDNLPTPQRQSLENLPIEQIQSRLAIWIGKAPAAREIEKAIRQLKLNREDLRPLALRMLRDHLGFQLSAKVGTLASENILNEVMPVGGGQAIDDITLLESQLASAGSEFSGLAAELNKLRLFHRQTLENLPVGVCSLDPNGEVLLWNLAMSDMTGVPSASAEGSHFSDLPAPWGPTLESFFQSNADAWPAHEIEFEGRSVHWYHLTKHRADNNSPLYSDYQVILMEDISERLRLIQELAHAERLTSVGRLAAGVAHEIGNPVTGISCLAQDILAETHEQDTRDYANTVLNLTERISSIVRTLMDFSRSGDGSLSLGPVNLRAAVDSAIQLLKLDKSAKHVTFDVSIDPNLAVVGDTHQLTQVFVNLLVNSRDASAPGNRIEISCQDKDDHSVVVQVTDQGEGIPEELLNRVMDPFFTTKEPGAGTGLGLSLVYSIVRLHRGSVKISSPVANNRGTRVSILLTRSRPAKGSSGFVTD
jgi:PAS domain S-box-containing protein